jgi:SAM-dependent methyltransferase
MLKDTAIVERSFHAYFDRPLKPFNELGHLFKDEGAYISYFKKVLYFTKAVIQPLESKGMAHGDSVLDLASGDGQMSLALALLGYRKITLFDMDKDRLSFGKQIIKEFQKDLDVDTVNGSALDLDGTFDVLICYQTIEHLSDEGNYSIAKKKCQIEFLERVNSVVTKLCYFNAPNRTFPIDGHDTGHYFFHWLPIGLKKYLIGQKYVRCSWSGISRPVTVSFLNRKLNRFRLGSNYYAFDSMKQYMGNYPPFDYMGSPIPVAQVDHLSWKKNAVNGLSQLLGAQMQKLLPVLSVIYVRRG